MGSIHEFCAEFHISLGKARRMEKRGWLRIDGATTPVDEIRLALGAYARQAEAQLSLIGNAQAEAAPADIAAQILDAYRNDTEAVGIVAAWVLGILPTGWPVGHAYVATRLLLGVPENVRQYEAPRLQRVLMNCRAHPNLVGHSFTVKQASRNVTYYQRKTLDL
jgi:hypothetical protein